MTVRWLFGLFVFFAAFNGPSLAQQKNSPETLAQELHPLKELKTLNGFFPFEAPSTLTDWSVRRRQLKNGLQVSLGLWPMPEKTDLKAVVHGKIDMGDYTIEKVYLQSFPGFFVTGNLYRPTTILPDGKKRPAILSPHGHFRDGRFMMASDEEVKREIDSGAEKFESNARSPLQSRCATLARMGCLVFHYDMIGYGDCTQIPHSLAHGFSKQRPGFNGKNAWGFFSPQAELRLQSIMGLQTWNSIRALDFLCSLDDVDDERIGVTGASGGGTQTFILCAIDPRPAAAFPAVMVSTAMQGGCTCENCCNIRVNTGNVEIAALFAPKPLGLTAADDWTKELSSKGFPDLQKVYKLYDPNASSTQSDAGESLDRVQLLSRTEFGHNYNWVSRETMYRFFNEHLNIGAEPNVSQTAEIDANFEKEIRVLTRKELTVFGGTHPQPGWSDQQEMELLKYWNNNSSRNWSEVSNRVWYPDQVENLVHIWSIAAESLIFDDGLRPGIRQVSSDDKKDLIHWTLTSGDKTAISVVDTYGQVLDEKTSNIRIVLTDSAAPNTGSDESPTAASLGFPFEIGESSGVECRIDLFGEGQEKLAKNRLVNNGREAAGYTFGYNRSLFACRTKQLLDLFRFLEQVAPNAKVDLFASKKNAPLAAVAFSMSKTSNLRSLHCHLDGFRFGDVTKLEDPNFLPGAAKYGDMEGFLALSQSGKLILYGESRESMPLLTRMMDATGQLSRLVFVENNQRK